VDFFRLFSGLDSNLKNLHKEWVQVSTKRYAKQRLAGKHFLPPKKTRKFPDPIHSDMFFLSGDMFETR
jgi:surfactin synthase thioesterase subunit